MASAYASENTMDFYGATYSNMWSTSPTKVVNFAFNSYSISMSTSWTNMPNLAFSLVGFWTGTSANLAGDMFPALIRIKGYLKDNQKANV